MITEQSAPTYPDSEQQQVQPLPTTIPLQPASEDTWETKYRLRDADNNPIDADVPATYLRAATAIAQVEPEENRPAWLEEFLHAMHWGATPAGRIMSNAGADDHKNAVSLINCTVSATIEDSMHDIALKIVDAALTLKAGCGIGYEFSTLRPDTAFVHGAGADTSGPLPFMDVYDKMCGTVRSAGARRGAQMATFDISHPDTPAFITAKREDGRLRNFNLSLLITDKFINAVKNAEMWEFMWDGKPFYRKNKETGELVKAEMPAKELWNMIMMSTYDFAEPGFLLIDRINQYNNLWFCEHLRATNPCGEQPLPPYGSCLLGSVILTRFVKNPFTKEAEFDWAEYYKVCRTFARMLDNVVEINGLPLAEQRHEIEHKRRHGMGYIGLGSALAMLGLRYGSLQAVAFTEELTKKMAFANYEEGAILAKIKGEAPVLKEKYKHADLLNGGHLNYNSNIGRVINGSQDEYTGRELFLASHYFDAFREDEEGRRILGLLQQYGCRFSHATSIAPTGTISFSFGNNASNGIEPTYDHFYTRNVIRPGRAAKEAMDVYSYEYLMYKKMIDPECQPIVMTPEQHLAIRAVTSFGPKEEEQNAVAAYCLEHHILPPYFVTTEMLEPRHHVNMQAAAQRWVDSSISKTINVPTDIPFDEFQNVYMYAYDQGLKGCTTFRFNPAAFQGVLVKKSDLANTLYSFMLDDGETVQVSGDTMVEYEGQTHTAANLFDAIKEGLYGKF